MRNDTHTQSEQDYQDCGGDNTAASAVALAVASAEGNDSHALQMVKCSKVQRLFGEIRRQRELLVAAANHS